jgi:membrane protein insertase Oxa1/YidC/SpoIIIJ
LEEFIQLKQEWIGFSLPITTEIQLPVKERKPALDLITKHKNKYLDLLKRDADIPNSIKGQAYKRLYHNKGDYINNITKYKKLKEVFSCTDVNYFIKAADELEEDEDKFFHNFDEPVAWHNCICIGVAGGYNYLAELYKFFMTNKDKYADENTGLSNIILTVIIEEDNEQRTRKMSQLLNQIRERRAKLDSYVKRRQSQENNHTTELNVMV